MTDPTDPDATRPPLESELAGLEPEPTVALEGLQGQKLNETYRIDKLIGRGGMGVVYKGVNIHGKHAVAIKVIKPQLAADPEFLNLFTREAEKLHYLNHDAVVRYFQIGFDPALDLHFLAFEYIDGPSVMKILDGKPVQTASLIRILRRLAEGMQAAHAKGIVHLDLSPDNILLPDAWVEQAKIIDFGIARKLGDGSDSDVATAFTGKYGYQAPEVFGRYGRRIGEWSDVYSLALTVLAMAKGRPLDMGHDKFTANEARRDVPDLSFLDESLRPLFTEMLQPDPNKRMQSMQQVLDGIAQAEKATPPTVADKKRPRRKRSWQVPGLIAAGIAAIAIGAFFGPSMLKPFGAVTAIAGAGDIVATAAAVPCSSIRAQSNDGIYRLDGWKAESSPWPDSLTGENVDRRGVRSIAEANAATCAFLARVLEATELKAPDVAMPGYRDLKTTDGEGVSQGVQFVLNADLPETTGPVLAMAYGPRGPVTARLASFLKPRESAKVATFERFADLMLVVLIVTNDPAAQEPAEETAQSEAEAFAWIDKYCRPGTCHVAAGWLEIRE